MMLEGQKGAVLLLRQMGGEDVRQGLLAALCRETGSSDFVGKPSAEQRRSPRLALPLRVHCRLNEHRTLIAFPLNVSVGGLFLPLSAAAEPRGPLALSLFVPGFEAELCCRGRIAWINRPDLCEEPLLPSGVGLQWIDLSTEGQALIYDLLAPALQKNEKASSEFARGSIEMLKSTISRPPIQGRA